MNTAPFVALQEFFDEQDANDPSWKPLHLVSAYRLFLATALLAVFLSHIGPGLLGGAQPNLFLYTGVLYFLASVFFVVAAKLEWPSFELQVYPQIYLDILAIVLLMHASGGISSGLGMLLVVPISASGTLMPGRYALVFAAMATMSLLGEQLYLQSQHGPQTTAYAQAGITGIMLFVTAVLAVVMARRGLENERLAKQRGIDLENLAALNAHIIQQMDAGILVVDTNGRVRLSNESARMALGLPPTRRHKTLKSLAPRVAHALKSWKQNPAGTPLPIKEPGSQAELQPQFTPVGDKGTLILLEDSSFINRQLQQLKLASLGRLTASIAHEIRNPLGAISHAAQLLAESDELPSPDRRLTDIILDHCKRVNTLIEDVLQLSRGGNAKPERMWLQEVLKRFTEDFAASERLSPEQLTLHLPELPAEIYVDPNHLNQVLWNLCKNAVIYGKKDNEPPQVRLEAGRLEDTGFPYLDVRDQGVGIPPDLAEEIFEPFYTSGVKGTGLGLFLSRELCEFNNATLINQPGNAGACFRIVFSREH